VAAENDPIAAGPCLDGLAQHQRKLEPGPLPGDPDDPPAVRLVELLQLLAAVRARRQRDRPVGVQVIDVRERQECMEGRVDRCRDAVLAERAQRVEPHHLILERLAAIAGNEAFELVHVQDREPGGADRPQVAAASFDRHDPLRPPGKWVGQIELRARVPPAEIGDAEVRAEQVRSVTEQLQRLRFEPGRFAVVPQVL
jgi:hypothetical protein